MSTVLDLIQGKWFMEKKISEMTTKEKYEAYRLISFYRSNTLLRLRLNEKYLELEKFVEEEKGNKASKQYGKTESLFPDIKTGRRK